MTTIRTFFNQSEAALCVSLLQAHGFDPVLLDEASYAWAYAGTAIPIRLQVPDGQAGDAVACLKRADSEGFDSDPRSDTKIA
ncbi:MAG TPA: hypothetical protein VJ719_00160 [Chthoniobacterales bacterium]|nr:hypothetical protein [Chthoniobacterales bacterium]